jgi:hypothetical protein
MRPPPIRSEDDGCLRHPVAVVRVDVVLAAAVDVVVAAATFRSTSNGSTKTACDQCHGDGVRSASLTGRLEDPLSRLSHTFMDYTCAAPVLRGAGIYRDDDKEEERVDEG